MPRKFSKRKKHYRKKRRNYNVVRLNRNPVALKTIVPMKYCQDITLNPGLAGAPDYYEFRANSIYDPDYTGVGHQPSGHDEWAQFYQHYNVIGSKISVNFASYTTGGTVGTYVVGISTLDTNGQLAGKSGEGIRELQSTRFKLLGIAGSPSKTVSAKFSSKKRFGKNYMDDDNKGTMNSSNPPEDAIFAVFAYPGDATSDASALYCQVTIQYLVALTEPKTLAQS